MLEHGLGGPQRAGIQVEAAMVERDSLRREKRREDYPKNMYDHVQDVAEYQNRDAQAKAPNVFYTHVPWGCGRPGNAACLTGWTGVGLLMHRLHTWGGRDDPTNPDSYHIEIDYSNTAHLHGLGFQGELVRSLVQVPLPERLYQVLQSMHPGPLARYASGVGYPSRLLRPNEEVEAIGVGNPLWMFHPSVLEVGGATEAPSILQSDDVGAAASGGVWDPPAWRRRDAETERSQDEDLRARFRQRVQLVADEPNEPAGEATPDDYFVGHLELTSRYCRPDYRSKWKRSGCRERFWC